MTRLNFSLSDALPSSPKTGSWTSTSVVRGVFADDAKTRQELMSLICHNPALH